MTKYFLIFWVGICFGSVAPMASKVVETKTVDLVFNWAAARKVGVSQLPSGKQYAEAMPDTLSIASLLKDLK